MEGNIAKVLDRRYRLVVDAKKRKASKNSACLLRSSCTVVPQLPGLKAPSASFGKRKKPDDCSAKCKSCEFASGRSLFQSYSRFMRSKIPSRLMCFQNDEWLDLPCEILDLVKKDFELKKGVTEVDVNGHHLLLDFLHMSHLDVKTGLEQPMAWIDDAGKCFFPEVFAFDNQQDGYCQFHSDNEDSDTMHSRAQGQQEIKLQIDIELNGLNGTPTGEYCGESNPLIKRVKIAQHQASHDLGAEVGDSCDRVSYPKINENNERLEKNLDIKIQSSVKTLTSEDVEEMFLKGMNSAGVYITNISRCSGSMIQARKELFQKQVEVTNMCHDNANVRYAWLASSKEALPSIMTYGLGPLGLPKFYPSYGIGVHLAAANYSGTSAKYCDVDENGLGHMILCRVIMGNMELVNPGSKQFNPSSENFDSGVDELDNPQRYIVWSMNINTHIYPEFVVSFKNSPAQEGCIPGSDKLESSGMTAQQSPDLRSNIGVCGSPADKKSQGQSNLINQGLKERSMNLNSNPPRIPKSPYITFPVLLADIKNKISADDMKAIYTHYESYMAKKTTRVDFLRTLRLKVGDPLLKSSISMMHSKRPSENESTITVSSKQG